jgi:radical SAM superfamily enzyme YgiQ (UPF0313 family)
VKGKRRIHLIYIDIETGFYPSAHHGLASLIAATRAAGHDVRLTHLASDTSVDDLLALVGGTDADAFGFSAMTNQFKHVRRFAPTLAVATGKPIVVGGVHATLAPREVASIEGVSCACQGEGEIFLPKWLDALDAPVTWADIQGCWPAGEDEPVGSFAEYPTDLDALAAPCYDDFDMRQIQHDLGGRLNVVVSRGCPYRCGFCCNEALRACFPDPRSYVRTRSPAGAVSMVKSLVDRHSPASIRFEDDLLLVKPRWRREFFDLYRREIALPMECNCRADILGEDLATELRDVGCVSVDIGIESGDEHLRNEVMGKNVSNEQILRAFEMLHRAGVHTYAYNILGLPTETEAMARRTYELNRRIRPSAGNVFYFYPYPGTALKTLAEQQSLLRDDYEQAGGYTERPSVRETHISYRALRRVFRKLKALLFLQRFRTFFPMPRVIKRPLAAVASVAFSVCPPLVDLFLSESRMKRWLRRMVFRV